MIYKGECHIGVMNKKQREKKISLIKNKHLDKIFLLRNTISYISILEGYKNYTKDSI